MVFEVPFHLLQSNFFCAPRIGVQKKYLFDDLAEFLVGLQELQIGVTDRNGQQQQQQEKPERSPDPALGRFLEGGQEFFFRRQAGLFRDFLFQRRRFLRSRSLGPKNPAAPTATHLGTAFP